MRAVNLFVFLCLFSLAASHAGAGACHAATGAPSEGGVLPDFSLPAPESSSQAEYLGIKGRGSFRIPQIQASVVIIEIFSMYCPHCQKEAPVVNKLYQAIADRPGLSEKVKILGIGAGNTPYEVKLFAERYKIPFPLFPDADFSLHELLGEVGTPYFVVVKIDRDGPPRVIASRLGAIGAPGDFLELVLKKSGLKGGK